MASRCATTLGLAAVCAALAGCPGDDGAKTAEKASKTAAGDPAAPAKAPFDRARMRSAWKDAKVGDWACYQFKERKQLLVVTAVEEKFVHFDIITVAPHEEGKPFSKVQEIAELEYFEEKYTPRRSLDHAEFEEKRVVVGGKDVDVLVVKRAKDDQSSETWYAEKQVPPFYDYGAVKTVRDGALLFEMLDFGRADTLPKPEDLAKRGG